MFFRVRGEGRERERGEIDLKVRGDDVIERFDGRVSEGKGVCEGIMERGKEGKVRGNL